MSEQQLKPELIKAFLHKVAKIRTFYEVSGLKEHSLSIDLSGLVDFYSSQIGSEPFVQTWDEIHQCLMVALDQARKSKPDDHHLVIRLTGKCRIWLAIKIYSALVFECDKIFYAGDVLMRL